MRGRRSQQTDAHQSGVISLQGLRRLEWSDSQVANALETGALIRVARGWFARAGAASDAVEAVRHGGRLGCLTGCRFHGLWTPQHRGTHIIIRPGQSRMREHWHRHTCSLPEEAVFPVADCLAQVIKHHSPAEALTVLESAVNLGKVSQSDALALIADTSATKQGQLKFFDPRAESGSETKVRLWLQQLRFPVRSQVSIPGVGRVDFVVGQSLIVECDSQEFHAYRDEDFRRDMAARALGYVPIRLSFRQVHLEWEGTQQYLLRLLRTGQHRQALRPL